MLPPRELNPFEPTSAENSDYRRLAAKGENTVDMQERVNELEARNLYLQSLVVELLDKNEQLRRKVAAEKQTLDQ